MLEVVRRVEQHALQRSSRKVLTEHISAERFEELKNGDVSHWATTDVETLARLAGVDPVAVWRGEVPPTEVFAYFYTTLSSDFDHDDGDICLDALAVARVVRGLQEVLETADEVAKNRAALPEVKRAPSKEAWRQGYQLARAVRKVLGWGDAPITDLDEKITRALGIPIIQTSLRSNLEAMALAGGGVEAILLNTAHAKPAYVRRLIAHELCHALFDPRDTHGSLAVLEPVGTTATKKTRTSNRTPIEYAEKRARAFACELLVPLKGARELLGPGGEKSGSDATRRAILRTCRHFDAPWALVAYHLAHHGCVARETARCLGDGAPPSSLRRPAVTAPFQGVRQLALEAQERGRITEGRGRELQALGRLQG